MLLRIIVILIVVIVTLYINVFAYLTIKNLLTKEIDLRKSLPNFFYFIHFKKHTIVPKLHYSITLKPSNYKPGFVKDGVEWKENYCMYQLDIKNTSKKVEVSDVRIKLQMIGTMIIKCFVFDRVGVQDATFDTGAKALELSRAYKDGKIAETFQVLANHIEGNIIKIFPQGKLILKLIVRNNPGNIPHGLFRIQYGYIDAEGKIDYQTYSYDIKLKDKKMEMLLDTTNVNF